ncbi:MAG TPA: class II glutamine amidotransferase [Candidatus Competibacteraceae bacterium]|nr:class II glutamine amidotransferase [Candidatus Competibacteraceae bacterium]
MCRLAAYIGPELRLDQLLLTPPHSLLVQAASGFGFGWYGEDGAPAVYLNPLPPWADVNLPHLARTLYSDLWLAQVHSATPPHGNGFMNNQPFQDGELLFLHQGFLDDFRSLRRTVRDFLDPAIEEEIHGNSASEHIFALLRHLLADDAELAIEDALAELFGLLGGWLEGRKALLNVVVSDGERLYAARHACNTDSPNLYYTIDDESFPEGQLIASERITDTEFWLPVPPSHLLILDPDAPPELLAL